MGNKCSMNTGSDASVDPSRPKASIKTIHRYKFGPVIHALYGGQRRIVTNNISGKTYCMHRVCKSDEADNKAFHNEVEVMRLFVGHPHVVQVVEVYEDDFDHIHLITELCDSNLIERFSEHGCCSEGSAADATRTLLDTVAYCHSMGVIIRDIKPENILLCKSSKQKDVFKIGNMGNAYIQRGFDVSVSSAYEGPQAKEEPDVHLTSFYPAPEVLVNEASVRPESDVWSLGMVLCMALSGKPPYWGALAAEVQDAILTKDLSFSSSVWDGISDDAKDFITKMTKKDYRQRSSIPELLAHPWLAAGRHRGTS